MFSLNQQLLCYTQTCILLVVEQVSPQRSAITPPWWNATLLGKSVFFHLWSLVVSFWSLQRCRSLTRNLINAVLWVFHFPTVILLKFSKDETLPQLQHLCVYFCQAFIFIYCWPERPGIYNCSFSNSPFLHWERILTVMKCWRILENFGVLEKLA